MQSDKDGRYVTLKENGVKLACIEIGMKNMNSV